MNTLQVHRNTGFKILAIFILLLSGFFVWLSITEFVTVGVLQETAGYPFGNESPAPWYYSTPALYAKVNLTFGILFLFAAALSLWAYVKGNKQLLIIAGITTIFFIIIQLVNGASQ